MAKLPRAHHSWVLEEADSNRLKDLYPDLWADPQESCITCQFETKADRSKTFRWLDDERSEVLDWECDCTSQWILHRKLLHHGIGKAYQRLGWMDAAYVPQEAQDATWEYLADSAWNVEHGVNLILHSPNAGTGKTLMLMLLAKGMIREGRDVYVAQMNTIVEMYTSGWRSADDRAHFERRIMNCGVLGIDDLGKEMGQNRVDFIDRLVDRVIRHRVAQSKPVVVTTNLTRAELDTGYNRYVASLLTESCEFVETSGRDFRPQARIRAKAEHDQHLTRPLVLR